MGTYSQIETYLINITKLQHMQSLIFQIVSFTNQLSFVEIDDNLTKRDDNHYRDETHLQHFVCKNILSVLFEVLIIVII